MSHPRQSHPATTTKTLSARLLFQHREKVLDTWMKRVRTEVKSARALQEPIIVNTIPLFIERLAESLCEETERSNVTESSTYAQEHGSERARMTRYGPEQVLQEYVILREVIKETLCALTTLSLSEESIIQKSFDNSVQDAMASYFLVYGRIREQFVAALTHDLRNPIAGVKLAADLIVDTLSGPVDKTATSDLHELALRILKQARRADRMIQDMLDASVVQIGETLSLNLSECDVAEIVADAVGDRPTKDRERLKIESIHCRGFWDRDAFQRSIENLLSNAIKYGDGKRPVTIKVRESHGRIMVQVHNFGNPIAIENLEGLFQLFRRADAAKSGNVKGWGIGLALARSTAEQMGGSLGAESSLEDGTTFTIDIPVDARPYQKRLTTDELI